MKTTDLDLQGQTTGQVKTFCPECHTGRKHVNERELQVNLDTGGYTCWHCGIGGYLVDVKSQYIVREKKEYKRPDPKPITEPDPEVVAYFEKRGISLDTLSVWKISYGPSFGVYDYTAPRSANGKVPLQTDPDGIPIYLRGIQFPYYEDGTLVNMKYLRPREWSADGERMFRSFTGGKPVPFGFDSVGDDLHLFEGEIDALSASEAGVSGCWSIPNGAKGFEWLDLDTVVVKLLAARSVTLAGDNDADGRACRDEMIRRLTQLIGPERLYVVHWPDDCKDANDVLVKHDAETLRTILEDEREPIPIDGISEVQEFIPEYLEFFRDGLPKGVSTGIPTLDPLYRVMPGMFTIVTGVTNYGKSEIMDEIVRCMIQNEGWKFAFYTPENSPTPLHMIKVAEKYVGKPFDSEKPGHMSETEARDAARWMQDSLFYINPRNTTYSIEEILEKAKVLVVRKGIQGLIIDPWNYVRKDFNGLREDQYINEMMQRIGVFTKTTGVHVWLTVHPRTLRKDKEGKIEVPVVMDLSGGSKFGDNADFMFAVHRDPQKAFETGIHEVTLHVQKSRYRYAAVQGHVTLEWEPFNGRFKALGDPSTGAGVEIETTKEYGFDSLGLGAGDVRPSRTLVPA